METLFVNGNIHTLGEACPHASVMAVRDGVLVYVGDDPAQGTAALEVSAAGLEIVDLQGQTVTPGLIDSHLHFLTLGQSLLEMDIFLKSKQTILDLVQEEAAKRAPGEWILGRGWNHECWDHKEWPRKEDLDAMAPHNPVALNRADSHSIWVNSLALCAAGIDRNSTDPPGGEILREPDGEARGILTDTAMYKVWQAMPAMGAERIRLAYRTAQAELFRNGITSVGDAWLPLRESALLREAYAAGVMKIRCYAMLATPALEGEQTKPSPVSGLFQDRFSLQAYKIVSDGSLGSRSAWLCREYADRADHSGNGRYSDEELYCLMRNAEERGFQVCVHAIGEAAVRQTVSVMEKRAKDNPTLNRRRIEHFQMANRETVARALNAGILPAMQTVHALSDRDMALRRLSPEALRVSYPWRSILDAGGIFANGSDAPMDLVSPFQGMFAAVSMRPLVAGEPDRRLSREEALKSYTTWAAYAEFAEQRKGSLEPGKWADFIVLDRDILTCPETDIAATKVLMTVAGGEKVYSLL